MKRVVHSKETHTKHWCPMATAYNVFLTVGVMSSQWSGEHLSQYLHTKALCDCAWMQAHLALVNGDGPGQLEGQLLSTQVDPTAGLKHPTLGLQRLCNAAQETHAREPWGSSGWVIAWTDKTLSPLWKQNRIAGGICYFVHFFQFVCVWIWMIYIMLIIF